MPNKPKKVRSKATAAEPDKMPERTSAFPKIAAMEKLVERQRKKVADTQAAGKPIKSAQDRLYELEDELRLLKGQ